MRYIIPWLSVLLDGEVLHALLFHGVRFWYRHGAVIALGVGGVDIDTRRQSKHEDDSIRDTAERGGQLKHSSSQI
jgi:hypothetical protein